MRSMIRTVLFRQKNMHRASSALCGIHQRNNRRTYEGVFFGAVMMSSLVFTLFPLQSFATTLFWDPPLKEATIGSTFTTKLYLQAPDQPINALEGRIAVPAMVDIVSISLGNSIIPLWIEHPHAEGRDIIFAGAIPGGFGGVYEALESVKKPGLLFTITLVAREYGFEKMTFSDITILAHDGKATPVPLSLVPFPVEVVEGSDFTPPPLLADTTPPEPFVPLREKSPFLAQDAWVVLFTTTDKESGVAYYEVAEEPYVDADMSALRWFRAESPYVLRDQSLRSTVLVKAVDGAGNERIVMLPPHIQGQSWSFSFKDIVALSSIFIFIFLFLLFSRRRCDDNTDHARSRLSQ